MKKMRKVVRKWQKFLGMVVMIVLLAGFFQITSFAETKITLPNNVEEIDIEVLKATLIEDIDVSTGICPYTMLADCIIGVSGASDGMHIDISTGTVGIASVLGVKDVKIYKKTWYGGWDLVAVCSGGESYDRGSMGISILYENAVKDAKYKITCIHYGDVNGYIEGENDSGEFTFTY